MHGWYLWKSEKGFGYPGTGDGCELRIESRFSSSAISMLNHWVVLSGLIYRRVRTHKPSYYSSSISSHCLGSLTPSTHSPSSFLGVQLKFCDVTLLCVEYMHTLDWYFYQPSLAMLRIILLRFKIQYQLCYSTQTLSTYTLIFLLKWSPIHLLWNFFLLSVEQALKT